MIATETNEATFLAMLTFNQKVDHLSGVWSAIHIVADKNKTSVFRLTQKVACSDEGIQLAKATVNVANSECDRIDH
jgi:hypothetical protein